MKANSHALRTSDEEGMHELLAEFRAMMNRAKEEFEGEWYKLMEVEMKTYDKNEVRELNFESFSSILIIDKIFSVIYYIFIKS